jgi:hypothetical protein
MRKLIGIAILLLGATLLLGQTTSTPPRGFENVREMVETEVMDIQIKAFIPDITTFKDKTDTYNWEGHYAFPKALLDVIQQVSKQQLTRWQEIRNKWLEESK